jgi:hypothetical protein
LACSADLPALPASAMNWTFPRGMRLKACCLIAFLTMASYRAGGGSASGTIVGTTQPLGGVVLSGDLTRVYELGPGGHAEGRLLLHNPTGETHNARIYQTDYLFTASGAAIYGEPGRSPRSTARWIELGEREAVLAPEETRAVPFKINVPTSSHLSGTYWSIIMVEPVGDLPGPSSPHTVTVRSIMRYGVQVVVQIGTIAQAKPSISHQAIVDDRGRHVLAFDLANDGERWLQPRIEVRLFDSQGHALPALSGRKARVYPGTSVHHAIELPTLPAGDYVALIVFDSDDETYGAQYRFHLDD